MGEKYYEVYYMMTALCNLSCSYCVLENSPLQLSMELPLGQKQELINQVKFAKERGYNSFTSDLYNQMYNYNYGSRTGVGGEDRSGLWARMNTPRARLEHTLGQYNFYTDENGNTIVTDIYDFNDNQKQRGDGKYANIRNGIAVTYGSRSSEPNEGKIKYKINLGKI